MLLSVFVLQELEPVGSHLYQVLQVAIDLVDLCLDACHQLVGFVLVEFQDALHLDLQQFEDIVLGDLTHQAGVVGCQSLVDMLADSIHVGCVLELLVFVDTLFDEDFLQGIEMILVQQLILANLELLSDEILGTIDRVTEHIGDGQELRLLVADHTTVG